MSDDVTTAAFTRQAASFEAPGSHFADRDLLAWIAGHVDVQPEDRVLDVAGGTGQLGRHLGRGARLTVIADLTPAMLRRGSEAVAAEQRRDVIFVRADAAALPFADAQFDVVVSRFALHHLRDVDVALREMRRVCAAGGTVTLIDIVAESGPIGERLDALERLRDPSHTACPREPELRERLAATGLRLVATADRQQVLAAEEWLDRAQPDAGDRAAVLAALRAEAEGGAATGLCPAFTDGVLTISHRYLLLHARLA